MSYIIGKEYCKLDSNGRFKFPIALKRQIGGDDGRFVIRQSIYAECLELWTYANFEAEVSRLQGKLNPYNKRDREIMRKLTDGNIIELDSNDRLLVPPEQKALVKKSKDLVLQSMGNFIEIWDSDTYHRQNDEINGFADVVDSRLGDTPTAEPNEPVS